MTTNKHNLSRRDFFWKSSALTAAAAFPTRSFVTNEDVEATTNNVNTNSQPSDLRITDEVAMGRAGGYEGVGLVARGRLCHH